MSFALVAAIVAGVLGLAIGSFLNVVVYRVPRHESVAFPPSHCPNCESEIKPWQNVPVLSWLVLRGRCASCAEPISLRYPLVEATTALLFFVVTLHFGVSVRLPALLYLCAIGVALSLIDLDVKRLPNAIVLPSYGVGLALLTLSSAVEHNWSPLLRALAAMAVLWLVFFAIVMAYPAGMGFGDVKLAGLLGLFLGAVSWSVVLVAAFGAFLLGSIVGIALILAKAADRKKAIPFGPFMLGAALLALFVSAPITHWYGHLLGLS